MEDNLQERYMTYLRAKAKQRPTSHHKDDVETSPYSKPDDPVLGDARTSSSKKGENSRNQSSTAKRSSSTADTSPPQRTRSTPTSEKGARPSHHDALFRPKSSFASDNATSYLIQQPETRPISQEQLVVEVRGIYAGLVMVEGKCIEVENAQSSQENSAPKLNNEQWQALIALHRTLLHEDHDFFLASQHPSASAALRRPASKYAMPARMWRHSIHSFLELLRHRLPGSLEHLLTFIYLAYSMMALLYETVPAFEDTWIECLGDLGRYRMAIEDDDIRDREVWTSVSRSWYSKATDKAPTTGRLYHHLAILSRPNAVQQLLYYIKAPCVPIPFHSARESLLALFEPMLSNGQQELLSIDAGSAHIHGILLPESYIEKLPQTQVEFFSGLDLQSSRLTRHWMKVRHYIEITKPCAISDYRKDDSLIMRALIPRNSEDTDARTAWEAEHAISLCIRTQDLVLRRIREPNIYPYFQHRIASAIEYLEDKFPWNSVSLLLNMLLVSRRIFTRITGEDYPGPPKTETSRPLPVDFAIRGLVWENRYCPKNWFTASDVDEGDKDFESSAMIDGREEGILWLGSPTTRPQQWSTSSAVAHSYAENLSHNCLASSKSNVSITGEDSLPSAHPASFAMTTRLYYYVPFWQKNKVLGVAFTLATCLSILPPLAAAVNVERLALVIGTGVALATSGTIPALQATEGIALRYRVSTYAVWVTTFSTVFAITLRRRDAGLRRQFFACVWFYLGFHLMGWLGHDQSTVEAITSWGPLAYTTCIFPAVVMFKVWVEHDRDNDRRRGRMGLEALAGLAVNLAAN